GVHPAGHQVIARTLGRCPPQNRGLDFDKALRFKPRANAPQSLMALHQVALHFGPAQIEIAILETNLLGSVFGAVDQRKRRWQRGAQDLDRTDYYLDFTGGQFTIDSALRTPYNLAFNCEIVFGPDSSGYLMSG